MISRRRFLRTTLLGGALLGVGGLLGRHLSGYRLDPARAARLSVLSAKEALIFDAIARRLLAPDGEDAPSVEQAEVTLFVDGYLGHLEEPLRADLRALLQLVEHGSWLFRFGGSRFTHMTPEAQDRTLADWASSRLAVRRQGLQALRSLAFLGYYRDDRTWPLLSYTGPMLPGAPRRPERP